MAQPMLLTYNLDASTEARLTELCRSLDIRVHGVEPWEYAQPIGALAGIPVASKPAATPVQAFTEPMLVMCHMLSAQLDDFLRAMRAQGLPRVALKAVLTPVNVAWTSRQLRDALQAEHERFCK